MNETVDNVAFGKRVADRRSELGLSQTELAEAAGMKQQGVASIESGKVERPRKLKEIAEALGVTDDWLLYGKTGTTEEADAAALRARVAGKLKSLKKESLLSLLDQVDYLVSRDQASLPPRGGTKG